MSNQPCSDCGVETLPDKPNFDCEYFMVHDHVWYEAGMGPRGFLCVGCLEARLGRQLVPADFPEVSCNDAQKNVMLLSDRLLDRMGWVRVMEELPTSGEEPEE